MMNATVAAAVAAPNAPANTGQRTIDMAYVLHSAVVLAFLFLFRFVPPISTLTPVSMQVIGVFVGVIYGWVNVGLAWPSLLGVVALGCTDYMPMTEVLQTAFGTQTVVMILSLLLLAAFVQQADLTGVVLDWLLGMKSAQGRPFLVLFYFLTAGFLAALLSQSIAVFVIFLGLFRDLMKKTGISPYSSAVPAFFVGMGFALSFGDSALPFKGSGIVAIAAYQAVTGQDMNLVRFVLFCMPLSFVCIGAYVLFCKYVMRVDLSALATYRHVKENQTLSRRKKVALAGVIGTLLLLLMPGIVPQSSALYSVFATLGLGGLSLLLLAILFIVRVEGEPLIDVGRIAPYFPWNVFLILVVLFPLANAISSDAVGLNAIISSGVSTLLTDMPTTLLIGAVIFLAAYITNFANNMIVCALFVTIVCLVRDSLPVHPEMISYLVVLSSSLSMFFPAANPINAIIFGQKDCVTFRQEVVHGFVCCTFLCVVLLVLGYLWSLVIF